MRAPWTCEPNPRRRRIPRCPSSRFLRTSAPATRIGNSFLAAAHSAATTGEWAQHYAALTAAIARSAASGPALRRTANLEAMLVSPPAALAFEHARFMQAVTPEALATFGAEPGAVEFLDWLFAHPAVLAAFDQAHEARDKSLGVLRQWQRIWADDPASRETLSSLAIACALVFDTPVKINRNVFGFGANSESALREAGITGAPQVDALDRFRFFRDSAKRGALKTPLPELMPWELVWVVNAAVPDSELLWAQQHVNFPRQGWSKAYAHIRYRMDKATQGVNPYTAYTLAQIEKEGGVCADQAYFAAMTAKANGIPAMAIGGQGDRGNHAWFGYETARNEWNLSTGRYASDNYAAGTTRHPQTGATIKEQELRQMIDPARRTAAYEKSEKLMALSRLLEPAGERELAVAAAECALRYAPRNFEAWQAHLDHLSGQVPPAQWLAESARARTAFRDFPDLVAKLQKHEAEVTAQRDAAAARELVHRQSASVARNENTRTDLYLADVYREADLAAQSGNNEAAGRIYRDALREKGKEIVAFKSVAGRFYNWAKNQGKAPETVRELVSLFDRQHTAPTDDVFAMGSYNGVLKDLDRMAKEQSLEPLDKSLERRIDKVHEAAKKLGAAQSKTAPRK